MKKRVIISISLILSLLTATAQNSKTVKSFTGVDIHGLVVSGAFDVQLSEGDETGVTIEIREDATSKLSVLMTEDKCVRISFADDLTKYFIEKKKPLAKVVVSRLDYLNLSGNVSLIAKGKFSCYQSFTTIMTGTAFASFINIDCDKATLDIKGKAKLEDFNISAAGNIDITTAESAYVAASVKCSNLVLESGLASDMKLSGTVANKVKVYSTGTSKITILDVTCPTIDATVQNMSRVNANVSGTANLQKSGMASFRYIGQGRISGDGAKPL